LFAHLIAFAFAFALNSFYNHDSTDCLSKVFFFLPLLLPPKKKMLWDFFFRFYQQESITDCGVRTERRNNPKDKNEIEQIPRFLINRPNGIVYVSAGTLLLFQSTI